MHVGQVLGVRPQTRAAVLQVARQAVTFQCLTASAVRNQGKGEARTLKAWKRAVRSGRVHLGNCIRKFGSSVMPVSVFVFEGRGGNKNLTPSLCTNKLDAFPSITAQLVKGSTLMPTQLVGGSTLMPTQQSLDFDHYHVCSLR